MKKRNQKLLAYILAFAIMFSLIPAKQVEAAKKLKVTNQKSITLVVKKTHKIKTNVSATFKSSNKKVATVSKKGVISAKKAGTAKITVTSKKNKNQKVIVKVTVKKQPKSTTFTNQDSTEQATTEQESTEQTSTKADPKPVSITANYTGGILPTYTSIDFTKLSVIATFEDNSTKNLSMLEYNLSTNYSKVEGNFTIEVYYQNLKTSFVATAKKITSNQYDYPVALDITYTGSYPLDISQLNVGINYLTKYQTISTNNVEYQGVVNHNGKAQHQYFLWYTEDFEVDGTPIHSFVYDYLFIPIS